MNKPAKSKVTPQVQPVNTVPTATPTIPIGETPNMQAQPNPLQKFLKPVIGVVGGLVAVGAIGYWAYANFLVGPEGALLKSMQGMVGVDSVRVVMDVPEADLSLEAKVHTDKEMFSEFVLVYEGEEMGENATLEFRTIAGVGDVYMQVDYSLIDDVLGELTAIIPNIYSMQTYALMRPVLTGSSWLRFDNPQVDEVEVDDVDDEEVEFSEEEKEFMEALKDAVVYNDFDRNYKMDGQKYRRVTIGFDKAKLLKAIDLLKDLDIDAKLSQINALKDTIENTEGWDQDLAEVLIDSRGKLAQVKISMPKVSEEAIQDAIDTSAEDGGMFGTKQLGNFFSRDASSEEEVSTLVHLFTMTFDQYDQVEEVARPSDVVESETVLEHAQVELMPVIYQIMMSQPGVTPRGDLGVGSGYPAGSLF